MSSLLAQAIAREEGYGIPGTIPTTHSNPGDLRHSPHSSHAGEAPDGIGEIDTPADGWADLERQLTLYASRGLTVGDMITSFYAPPSENDSARYVQNVCNFAHCSPDDLVSAVLAQGD
jgi:hypothetical protein